MPVFIVENASNLDHCAFRENSYGIGLSSMGNALMSKGID